jgi:hypothetical protein
MSSDVNYRSHVFALVAGYTVLTGLLGYFAETSYREFFESIIKLAQSEEYSYIIVSFFTTFAVLYLSARYIGFSYGVRPSKVVLAIGLLVFSVAFYLLAQVDLEHRVHLMGLSFACVFIALILLIYEPNTPGEVAVLLTPLLLVPLPIGVVDYLTPILSRHIGRVVGFLTGARVVEAPGFTQLEVISQGGEPVRLSVEAVCTGIITASSIIAITPLIVYIASFSVDRAVKKAAVSIASLLIGLLVGLTGNFIRVLIVVYAAMKIGVEQAYSLFHYSPSLLYSVISILLVFYIVNKYLKFKAYMSRSVQRSIAPRVTWEYVAGVLLLVIVVTGAMSIALHATSTITGLPSVEVNASSLSEYLQNPAKYLSTSRLKFIGSIYDSFLTRVLGALATYRVLARFVNSTYTGYIEVVDTPARLHTWELCLTLQGYFVKASWSSDMGGFRVNFISIERGGWRGVLAHTIVPLTVKTPIGEYSIYTRISLVGAESGNITGELATALLSIIQEHSSQVVTSGGVSGLMSVLSQSSTFILSALFVYFIVLSMYKYRAGRITRG